MKLLSDSFKPVVAMLQLSPLPGSARYDGTHPSVIADSAVADARRFHELGFDGVQIQNMGDEPGTSRVGPETVAYMTAVAVRIRSAVPDLSVSVLVNWDGEAGLAVAHAADTDFVRIEHTFVGATVTPWGISNACAHQVTRLRAQLRSQMPIFADVLEPHGIPIVAQPVERLAEQAVFDAGADGLYVTGQDFEQSLDYLNRVRQAVPDVPLFLGGGATVDNVADALAAADGVTVASWLKHGDLRNPVDWLRAEEFIRAARSAREKLQSRGRPLP